MKISFAIFFLFVTLAAQAQDVIYKKDKTKIDGKVLEIGTDDVKYKPTANPDGPVYTIDKSEIATIVFQNGTFEVFSDKNKWASGNGQFSRDFLGIDLGAFVARSLGIAYEHVFGHQGNIALRVPVILSPASNTSYGYGGYREGKIFGTGFDLLCFPTGQGVLRYYVGPYFEYGWFRYRSSNYSYYNYTEHNDGRHYAGGIKNGLQYCPTLHFSVTGDFGLGFYQDYGPQYSYSNQLEPHVQGNLIIGYRF